MANENSKGGSPLRPIVLERFQWTCKHLLDRLKRAHLQCHKSVARFSPVRSAPRGAKNLADWTDESLPRVNQFPAVLLPLTGSTVSNLV